MVADHQEPAILQHAETWRDPAFLALPPIRLGDNPWITPAFPGIVAFKKRDLADLFTSMAIDVTINRQQPPGGKTNDVRIFGETARTAPDISHAAGERLQRPKPPGMRTRNSGR
jgi:hypothetical protein